MAHDEAIASDPEACLNHLRRVFRNDYHEIGAPGMLFRQDRIVPADFGTRPFRMIEEIQIVDGHDLEGAAGRHQQRVSRVGDVDRPREELGWRPFEPTPGEVEQANRASSIHAAGRRNDLGGRY